MLARVMALGVLSALLVETTASEEFACAQGTASNQEACGTNATSESFLQHDIHRETMEVVTDMVEICPGACGCGQYQTEEIVFSCNQSQGTKTFNLALDKYQTIVNVSKGTNGVSIKLNATGDIDLKLYDGSQCVFGFGQKCTNSNGTVEYDGLNITFSGDKQTSPVIENITIEGVTKRILVVKVHAYAEGTGEVAFTHGKIEPCDAQKPVCSKCSEYNKCGAGKKGKCDGTTKVQCIALPTEAPTAAPSAAPTAPTAAPTSAPTAPDNYATELVGNNLYGMSKIRAYSILNTSDEGLMLLYPIVFQTRSCEDAWMALSGSCNLKGMDTCTTICSSLGHYGPDESLPCPDGRPSSSSVFVTHEQYPPDRSGYGPGVSTASSMAPKCGYSKGRGPGGYFFCGYSQKESGSSEWETTSCKRPLFACKCRYRGGRWDR